MNDNNDIRRTIEIGGVKIDVDLRTAVRVETLKVGDRIRVLVKQAYSTRWDICPGVVVGFEPFRSRPTIVICYLQGSQLVTTPLNEDSADIEIVPALDDTLMLERDHVVTLLQAEIRQRETALDESRRKLDYFERMFGRWFESENAPGAAIAS